MNLYFNDCSLHGQFPDVPSFEEAIGRLMLMKQLAARFGNDIYCHKNCMNSQVTRDENLPQVINKIDRNRRLALLQWFTKYGPFWDDVRQHSADQYLDCNQEVVTDTVVGECAVIGLSGESVQLTSITPSDWEANTLEVCWHKNDQSMEAIHLCNHINSETLETTLQSAPLSISSWDELSTRCIPRFSLLNFSEDAFEALKGVPFHPGVAESLVRRLDVLNQLKAAFDPNGNRTDEGNRLYQEFFNGKKAWFTDSGPQEKIDFKNQLTFKHPENDAATLFATWHGKVKTPQMRIHFDWDFSNENLVYVVYLGPKLTKR